MKNKKSDDKAKEPLEDRVLRRMLETPPKLHKHKVDEKRQRKPKPDK